MRLTRPLSKLLLCLLTTTSVAVAEPEPGFGLAPARLFNGVGLPIDLEARAPSGVEIVDLALMDERGLLLAVPRSVAPGGFDLAVVMPAAAEIAEERHRACWLQMLVGDEPMGPALVLEPMLTRLVPETKVERHPAYDRMHTKIVGWRAEEDDAPSGETDAATPTENESDVERRVFTGLRIYRERDVMLRTSHGDVRIALRPDEAPNTAWNFRSLAGGGFYRGVVFHRIVPRTRDGDPFVIQGGDPSRTGEGGPGYWLPIEPSGLPHDFGVISMARADAPDSAGSQFFICLSRAGTARLDGQYCAFGYAVSGSETITAIADVELADIAAGRPVEPPVIRAAELVPAPPRVPGRGRPDARVTAPIVEDEPRPTRIPR